MKEAFDELYRLALLDRKKSPWSRQHSLEERHQFIMAEATEIGLALRNNDMRNLREELGDTMFTLLSLIAVCEEKRLFKGEDIVHDALQKFKRRKPWIFTNEVITADEELRRWKDMKQQEKNP